MTIEGVVPAVLTPIFKGRIEEQRLREVVDFLIEKGVHGFFACGSAGEGPLLTTDQRKKVAEIIVDQTNGRIPVMVHVGSISTATAIELAKHAEDIGADAVSSVSPYYYRHDRVAVVEYFKSVAGSVDMPFYLYNVPERSGFNITPDVVEEIVEACPNVVGVKESSRDVNAISKILSRPKLRNFSVLVGGAWLLLPSLAVGGTGTVDVISNVFPEIVVDLYESVKKGNLEKAKELHAKVVRIWDVMWRLPYPAVYKEALRLRGIDLGGVTRPLRDLTEDEKKILQKLVEEVL